LFLKKGYWQEKDHIRYIYSRDRQKTDKKP